MESCFHSVQVEYRNKEPEGIHQRKYAIFSRGEVKCVDWEKQEREQTVEYTANSVDDGIGKYFMYFGWQIYLLSIELPMQSGIVNALQRTVIK